jgi:hypothetical protein
MGLAMAMTLSEEGKRKLGGKRERVRKLESEKVAGQAQGAAAFRNSTLLKLLNQGKYAEVPAQLRRWIYAGGKKCKGLANRREKEVEMWEGEGRWCRI